MPISYNLLVKLTVEIDFSDVFWLRAVLLHSAQRKPIAILYHSNFNFLAIYQSQGLLTYMDTSNKSLIFFLISFRH